MTSLLVTILCVLLPAGFELTVCSRQPGRLAITEDPEVHMNTVGYLLLGPRPAKKVPSNIRKILHMRKVLSGLLLSIQIFFSIKWFYKRTLQVLIRLRGCAG